MNKDLHNIINQPDLIDICRILLPTISEYTLFLSAHRTFTKIDHFLGCKTCLSALRKI